MNVDDLYGTLYVPKDGTMDPAGTCTTLTRAATARGATVMSTDLLNASVVDGQIYSVSIYVCVYIYIIAIQIALKAMFSFISNTVFCFFFYLSCHLCTFSEPLYLFILYIYCSAKIAPLSK